MATKYTVSVREVVGDVDMEMDSSRSSRQTEKNHNNVRQGITLATKGCMMMMMMQDFIT